MKMSLMSLKGFRLIRFIKDDRHVRSAVLVVILITILVVTAARLRADTGDCGGSMISLPFTDVGSSSVFFCSIAEAYFSALTNGATPTTYNPSSNVPREQMAAFITRTMDQTLVRGSRRAALDQYWTSAGRAQIDFRDFEFPSLLQSDGTDIWVAYPSSGGIVVRNRGSDGKKLGTWTAASGAHGVLCAMGKVFVTGTLTPGALYQIDPRQPAGDVTTVSSTLGATPRGIAYDGQRIWTANQSGSVSIVSLDPVSVISVSTGFTELWGILYDGTNVWVTDTISGSSGKLHKLDSSGAILMSIDVGTSPRFPAFDGTNIWVPNLDSNSVSVVRRSTGALLATLTGNGINLPKMAAFDGDRILVTCDFSVSLWKAADLTPIGTFSAFGHAQGACSDGLNFWVPIRQEGVGGNSWLTLF